ncbi:hypothetical protein CHELA1G11_21694 [Hyphomicrobiales bacterium]|nr:hypothetical protein CHELA1G11_21694 [Hyphomicrobiales bacterium]CAH1695479.1 hypothetical protein CHELA1G2_21999 [Hyphomicrobiales bacterium]
MKQTYLRVILHSKMGLFESLVNRRRFRDVEYRIYLNGLIKIAWNWLRLENLR